MRGTARPQAPPARKENARERARERETGRWGGNLDRIALPVSVVAAVGGRFAREHVRIRPAIIDGTLSVAVSLTHRERRRTAAGVTFGAVPVTAEGSPS